MPYLLEDVAGAKAACWREAQERQGKMSSNMNEAIERQRKLLYANKTNEQLIMIALHRILVSVSTVGGNSALLEELDCRYRTEATKASQSTRTSQP